MTGEANQALELDELKALCAAATEGPWYQSPDAPWHVRTVLENALIPLALKDGEPIAAAVLDADAAFIAAARQAVPVLIAEVERLTQERDQARDIAVALEQQTAEIERIARDLYSRYGARGFEAAEAILRVLNPEPDEPRRRCAYCDALAVPGLPNHNDWPVCAEHADDIQRLLETETQQ